MPTTTTSADVRLKLAPLGRIEQGEHTRRERDVHRLLAVLITADLHLHEGAEVVRADVQRDDIGLGDVPRKVLAHPVDAAAAALEQRVLIEIETGVIVAGIARIEHMVQFLRAEAGEGELLVVFTLDVDAELAGNDRREGVRQLGLVAADGVVAVLKIALGAVAVGNGVAERDKAQILRGLLGRKADSKPRQQRERQQQRKRALENSIHNHSPLQKKEFRQNYTAFDYKKQQK